MKIVSKTGIRFVFSAPNKLSGVCKLVNSENLRMHQESENALRGRFLRDFLVVRRPYTEQTGRCLNDSPREHVLTSGRRQVARCQRIAVPAVTLRYSRSILTGESVKFMENSQ